MERSDAALMDTVIEEIGSRGYWRMSDRGDIVRIVLENSVSKNMFTATMVDASISLYKFLVGITEKQVRVFAISLDGRDLCLTWPLEEWRERPMWRRSSYVKKFTFNHDCLLPDCLLPQNVANTKYCRCCLSHEESMVNFQKQMASICRMPINPDIVRGWE